MSNRNIIPISEEELKELKDSKELLDCLVSAGVDNWSGWDTAQAMYRGEDPWA